MHRIYLAFLCFFRVLFGNPLPAEVLPPPPEPKQLPEPREAPPAKAASAARTRTTSEVRILRDGSVGALQLLAIFQREGRLIDFLCEKIDGYDDTSVGVAARDMHRALRRVLDEHFGLEPVVGGKEDDAFTVPRDFDPSRIRLVGNVSGDPPFRGILRHHGWRAARVKLPALAENVDVSVVAPAEVEIG